MKYTILVLAALFFTSCSSNLENIKPFKEVIKTKKYYSYKEYQEKKLTIVYGEYLDLLNKNITDEKEMIPIVLKVKYNNFDEIIKDEHFFDNYAVDGKKEKNLMILVYTNDKAIVSFSGENVIDKRTKCFYVNYYLLKLEKNILKVFYLDSESGEIAIPYEN